MAKSGAQPTTEENQTQQNQLPNLVGFDDVGRPDIDGWFKPSEDLQIYGQICGFFAFQQTVKDRDAPSGFRVQTREALCVRLGMPTKLFKKGDETGFVAEKGKVGAISMMYALEDIRPYIEKRGLVYIKFNKKVSTGQGQSVWKATVKCKGEKAAPAVAVVAQAPQVAESSEDDGVIPF